MSETSRALDMFGQHLVCSQSVLAAFCPRFGLDEQAALQVARCFGGGAGLGLPCGAVLGALMVLGLNGGPAQGDDNIARRHCYEQAREFTKRFSARFGALLCSDLLGLDLSVPEDYQQAREEDVFGKVCPDFVEGAAQILEEMLAQPDQARNHQ
jgi:C_GCAxxG_C_C family probable redox protein